MKIIRVKTAAAPFDAGNMPLAGPETADGERFERALKKARLSPEQYNMIGWAAHLAKDELAWTPVTRESRSLQTAQSRMLRRLEERGLIQRLSATPTKKRTTHIVLTEAGWALLDVLRSP